VRAGGVALVALLISVALLPPRLAAQGGASRPTIAVVNLRFDGEHANVLQPGDTAVVAAATSKLLATLRASDVVTLVDSSNLSNLVWLLTAELFDASTGKPVLADSYEIKGDAARMAPAGAHVFAQRVEKTIGGAR